MNNNLSNLKTTWQDIKKIATEIKILNNIKLAKFNQLISYTSELLNSCDMTLLPTSTDNAMSNCKEIIANLKNDYNDDSINNALKALDNVIVCISPYVVNDSTAKAASIGINEYHSIVENYIKIMEEKKKEIDSLDLEGKKAK